MHQARNKSGFAELYRNILKTDLCSYCGACVPSCPESILTYQDEQPSIIGQCDPTCRMCYDVCPETGENSDLLTSYMRKHGVEQSFWVARAQDQAVLNRSGSGGVTTAICKTLLQSHYVDAVILTRFGEDKKWEPVPILVTDPEEVITASRPKYALSPTVSILEEVAKRGLNKVAFVGLPCHVEAIRALQAYQHRLKSTMQQAVSAIQYTIGLWCGNNFTLEGTEQFIQTLGIDVNEITDIGYERIDGGLCFFVEDTREKKAVPFQNYLSYLLSQHIATACSACRRWHSPYADLSIGGLDQPGLKWSGIIVQTREGEELFHFVRTSGAIEYEDMPQMEVMRLHRKSAFFNSSK